LKELYDTLEQLKEGSLWTLIFQLYFIGWISYV